MSFKVKGNRILVKIIEENNVTKAGIILPNQRGSNTILARVVKVGEGQHYFDPITRQMNIQPIDIKENSVVLIPRGNMEITYKQENYLLVEVQNIIFEIDEDPTEDSEELEEAPRVDA